MSGECGEAQATVRLDRWLCAARFYKSRSLAAQACDGGKVKVNGQAAKAHRHVRAGDVVSVSREGRRDEFRVASIADRRGPSAQARLLYESLVSTETLPKAETVFAPGPFPGEMPPGRPGKRDRRRLDGLRGRWGTRAPRRP